MKKIIQCEKCKHWFLKKDYDNHLSKCYSTQFESNKEKILTTDDSGVLITIEDYAKLRGALSESEQSGRNYYDSNMRTTSGNDFKKIAQMSNKPPAPPQKNKQPLIECRFCDKFIEKEKIGEHNKLCHPDKLAEIYKQDKYISKLKHKKENQEDTDLAPEGKLGNIAEALKQALNEFRYGAKGMHHRHEWDGKFGSTPLHDDYGDESDSE